MNPLGSSQRGKGIVNVVIRHVPFLIACADRLKRSWSEVGRDQRESLLATACALLRFDDRFHPIPCAEADLWMNLENALAQIRTGAHQCIEFTDFWIDRPALLRQLLALRIER